MREHDEETETEAVVLEACEHQMVVSNDDGSVSRLVPLKEGRPVPPGATGMATVRLTNEPGKLRVTHIPFHAGPARVVTNEYRSGWDATFKKLDGTLN
jgi:hypothetical protein